MKIERCYDCQKVSMVSGLNPIADLDLSRDLDWCKCPEYPSDSEIPNLIKAEARALWRDVYCNKNTGACNADPIERANAAYESYLKRFEGEV